MPDYRFFEGGGLPCSYTEEGFSAVFNTDFRAWLKYEYLCSCDNLSGTEKVAACIGSCIKEATPEAPPAFFSDAMRWFHSRTDIERMRHVPITPEMTEGMAKRRRTFDLFWDFYALWASFKEQYGIDLYSCGEMHWWEFRRLLDAIKPETPLGSLRQLRAVTRAEIVQNESGLKALRGETWARIVLDKYFAALPGEDAG